VPPGGGVVTVQPPGCVSETNVVPAGSVSAIDTPVASEGPLFVTTIVYARLAPAATLAAALFVTDTSALAAAPDARQAENSDVLAAGSVAVAVNTVSPTGSANVAGPKATLPLPSVVTFWKPRKCLPSPKPDVEHAGLPKNSTRNVVFGVLFSVPESATLPPPSSPS
jgi:hypothetical protein